MSYDFYRVLHVVGIILLFSSLGALTAMAGSTNQAFRRFAGIAHGVALVLVLVAGFGLLARLGMFGAIPTWAWIKLFLWLALAMIIVPLKRKPELGLVLWTGLPILGALAAWLAITKPF